MAGPLLILQAGDPPPAVADAHGPFADWIRDIIRPNWSGEIEVHDVREQLPRGTYAGVIITGSASHVHDREPWVVNCESWLRDVASRVPILGICFGHQLLGQALGGKVGTNPRGREMGCVSLRVKRMEKDPILAGIPSSFDALVTHQDTILELAPGAETLGFSEGELHQIVRFSPAVYGVQFHPEMDAAKLAAYVDVRQEDLVREGFDLSALRSALRDTPVARRILENFVGIILSA